MDRRDLDKTVEDRYDVVVLGGGLAGLCLAIQLRRANGSIRVLVAERSRHPLPEAAHKVGESSVELASYYFRNVLGLEDALAAELRKFGLRFFMSHADNRNIRDRLECGPSDFLTVPSYQLDRGRFENALGKQAERCGVEFIDGCEVTSVAFGLNDEDHMVGLRHPSGDRLVRCRWVADASGRAALLKKQLDLARPNNHHVNACWFRIDRPLSPDDWCSDPSWRARLEQPRRLSTNHLLGEGYWVWLIPLVNDRTSIGIVADDQLHAFSDLNTFDKALAWLDAHEPQCAAAVRANAEHRMDFLALRNYSHDVKQMFSSDRWCLTGDAGIFIDPFYSPGSDFIAMANSFACDLIQRDLRGEDIGEISQTWDQSFRSITRTYLANYQRQYPLMGNARVMTTKMIWDFVMYWGGVALLFSHDRMCDAEFAVRVRPLLQGFAYTNLGMQAFFRRWMAKSGNTEPPPAVFVDYAKVGFLARMNRELQGELDDDALFELLSSNLELARELKLEIIAEAARSSADLASRGTPPTTSHLAGVFEAMRGCASG